MILATHPCELAQAGYEHLLIHGRAGSWWHVGEADTPLARLGGTVAGELAVHWQCVEKTDKAGDTPWNCFIDGNALTAAEFADCLESLGHRRPSGFLCGTGMLRSSRHRAELLDRFPDRISIISSVVWVVVPDYPHPPVDVRGAVFLPCHGDTWRVEQNLAWRTELVAGLDVHVFDDNHAPAETDRLAAIARECGWCYHRSGLGEHPDYTASRAEFSDYNRFIWESLVSLGNEYDFVIKLDTDACPLRADWWHEAAARLTGREAMLGTYDLRPAHEVTDFWQVARRHGYSLAVPRFPMHLQGGTYALSRGALQRLKGMGFLAGPHNGFTEDGYMSYCAQLLGIELLAAATIGSWSSQKRPPWWALTHLRSVHPLMRRRMPSELEPQSVILGGRA